MGSRSLLISGNSAGGGLFVLDTGGVATIDRLRTHGLALRDERLYRVMACVEHARPASDLLVYDRFGVRRFDRLDGIGDAHDVLPRAADVLIVSSTENAIYSIGADGVKTTLWRAAVPDDSWHLNCAVEVEGELYASAFGRFERHREWSREPQAPSGVLIHVPSERVVLKSLTQPHSPRYMEGAWLVCNSALHELAAYDAHGSPLMRRNFDGYTRGLAFDESYLYVGESANHHAARDARQSSWISILDRRDWSLVDRYQVDAAEVYDVLLVPDSLVAGAAIGFRTNATRVEEQDQLAMFASVGVSPRRLWALGEPLAATSLRASLVADIPAARTVDEVFVLPCRVTNLGDAIFVSAPPNPIQFCYRWFDPAGEPVDAGEWIHTPLPRPLPPRVALDASLRIVAPHVPGAYTLAVTLLQEGVAWFDDLEHTNGTRGTVVVGAR